MLKIFYIDGIDYFHTSILHLKWNIHYNSKFLTLRKKQKLIFENGFS